MLLIHHYAQINKGGYGIFLLLYFSKGMMKGGNKQEEAWINPFVKQFSNISFSVSVFLAAPAPFNGVHKFTFISFFVFLTSYSLSLSPYEYA